MILLDGIDSLPSGAELVTIYSPKDEKSREILNTNRGSHTGNVVRIAFTRRTAPDQEVVTAITVLRDKDKTPAGYKSILYTPCGIEADLNHGKDMDVLYLAIKKQVPVTAEAKAEEPEDKPPLGGQWKLSDAGIWTPKVLRKTKGRLVLGTYGPGDKCWVRGVLFKEPNGTYKLMGRFHYTQRRVPGLIIANFDAQLTTLIGKTHFGGAQWNWNGKKDFYSTLTYQRDPRILWKDGKEIFSTIAQQCTLKSMLKESFCPQVLEGLICQKCNNRCNAMQWPCVVRSPSHMLMHMMRFSIDYGTQSITKILLQAQIEPIISLPPPPSHLASYLQKSCPEALDMDNVEYGLYAIVVHAGLTMEGGHYFVYARDSEADLSK